MICQIDSATEGMVSLLIQAGFAGAFLVTMWVLFWLIRQRAIDWKQWMESLIGLHKETQEIVKANSSSNQQLTGALSTLTTQIVEQNNHTQKLYETMLERPCLIQEQRKGAI